MYGVRGGWGWVLLLGVLGPVFAAGDDVPGATQLNEMGRSEKPRDEASRLTSPEAVALGLDGLTTTLPLEEAFRYGQQLVEFARNTSRFLRAGVSLPLHQRPELESDLYYRLKAYAPVGYSSSGSMGTVGLHTRIGEWQLYLEAQPKVDIRELQAEVNASLAVKVRF